VPLPKGKLSDVIKTKEGYEIIKVLEKSDKGNCLEARKNICSELFWKKRRNLQINITQSKVKSLC
jgi:parvulin-like peptidyl-prolyl isomerase